MTETLPFAKPFDELLDDARGIANGFERYLPAARHLDALKSRNEEPTLAVPA